MQTKDAWDPRLYDRFRAERQRPFFDLLALLQLSPAGSAQVVDLGCGTGELTLRLHRHLQARSTLGIDSSAAMLARAAELQAPGLRFEQGDLRDFAAGGPWDVVFSNAALHWVPDHAALFERLTAALAAGGQLAVQVPANFDHPSHRVAAEVAAEEPFRTALADRVRLPAVLPPEEYAELLDQLGFGEQTVQLRVYGHRLAGPEEVVEWVRGTLLTEYQRHLDAALFARFLDRYRERLRLPARRPFFYPFKRILLWGRRK